MNTSFEPSSTRLVEFQLALVTAPFVLLVGLVLYIDYGTATSSAATTPATAVHATSHTIPTFDMTIVTDDQTSHHDDIAATSPRT